MIFYDCLQKQLGTKCENECAILNNTLITIAQ